MMPPKQIFILKIVSGNYGKLSACLSHHYPNSTISPVDLECLHDISQCNDIFVVIPGVGSFEQSISRIRISEMHNSLVDMINNPSIPKLAICLGFQILFSSSEESFSSSPALGLDIYSGNLLKFLPPRADYIVNTGYKAIADSSSEESLGPYFFNHSYYLPDSCINANLESFTSTSISNNGSTSFLAGFHDVTRNLVGTQYHPEMSRHTPLLDVLRKVC